MKTVPVLAIACSSLLIACGEAGKAAVNIPAESVPALCGINYPAVPNGQSNAVTLVAEPGLNYATIATSGSAFSPTQLYDLNIFATGREKGLTAGPFSGQGAVCIKSPEKPLKANDTVMTYFGEYTYLMRFEGREGRDPSQAYILEAYTLETSGSDSEVAMSAFFRIDPANYPAAMLDDQNLDICRADYMMGTWRVACKPVQVLQDTRRLTIQAPLIKRDAKNSWVFLVSTAARSG